MACAWDLADLSTVRTWHFLQKCLLMVWNQLNFLFVGCRNSIMVSLKDIPSASLSLLSSSISQVLIVISLPEVHMFWHVQSLSTFTQPLMLSTALSSSTSCIWMCKGKYVLCLFTGIQCHQKQFCHVDIQFVDINVESFDLLVFWDGTLGSNVDCLPPETNWDILDTVQNSFF